MLLIYFALILILIVIFYVVWRIHPHAYGLIRWHWAIVQLKRVLRFHRRQARQYNIKVNVVTTTKHNKVWTCCILSIRVHLICSIEYVLLACRVVINVTLMVQYLIIYSWSETVIWTGDFMLSNEPLFVGFYLVCVARGCFTTPDELPNRFYLRLW